MTVAKIEHNLTNEELVKALATLADQSEIGEELLKAVKARTSAIDDTPKEPRYPAMRHIYRVFMAEHQKAMKDIERYAEKILFSDTIRKSTEHVSAYYRHNHGMLGLVSAFYRVANHHKGQHIMSEHNMQEFMDKYKYHYYAYHGTTDQAAHEIAANGFTTMHSKSGKKYGLGIYASPNISESDYWAENNIEAQHESVILKVAIGANNPAIMTRGEWSAALTPYLKQQDIMGQIGNNFKKGQALVEYYRMLYFMEREHDVLVLTHEKPDSANLQEWLHKHGGNQIIVFNKQNIKVSR